MYKNLVVSLPEEELILHFQRKPKWKYCMQSIKCLGNHIYKRWTSLLLVTMYCIRHIFRESNFSRIRTSRHFREWLNSRSRRRAMDKEISTYHSLIFRRQNQRSCLAHAKYMAYTVTNLFIYNIRHALYANACEIYFCSNEWFNSIL